MLGKRSNQRGLLERIICTWICSGETVSTADWPRWGEGSCFGIRTSRPSIVGTRDAQSAAQPAGHSPVASRRIAGVRWT